MNFRVGQKVVCIPDAPFYYRHSLKNRGAIYPTPGVVYTVRWLNRSRSGDPILALVEIDNSHVEQPEPGFNCAYFRPATERKTDISIFTKMLDGTRVNEPA